MTPALSALPLILLANPDEVFARSLESVLTPAGYAVLRATTSRSVLEQNQTQTEDSHAQPERPA